MFHLEPYTSPSSRYECPKCHHKHEFVRYVDEDGKHVFPDYVGRCNREQHCGYHYTPKMFFRDHPQCTQEFFSPSNGWDNVDNVHNVNITRKNCTEIHSTSYIPRDMMEETLGDYRNNNFFLFLENLVGETKALEMIGRYFVGTTDRWKGATIFWQVDVEGRVHHGKIMQYNFVTGHREKQFSTFEYYKGLQDFHLEQCFFGEHLLINKEKVVALVESEKTAIIATEFMPEFAWLASGGASGCINQRMHILAGRKIVLFPDLGKESEWEVVAAKLRTAGAQSVSVSHVLEQNASESERRHGFDISDYLIAHLKNHRNDDCPF